MGVLVVQGAVVAAERGPVFLRCCDHAHSPVAWFLAGTRWLGHRRTIFFGVGDMVGYQVVLVVPQGGYSAAAGVRSYLKWPELAAVYVCGWRLIVA